MMSVGASRVIVSYAGVRLVPTRGRRVTSGG